METRLVKINNMEDCKKDMEEVVYRTRNYPRSYPKVGEVQPNRRRFTSSLTD